MAIAKVRDGGSGATKSSASTLTLTVPVGGHAIGSLVVVSVGWVASTTADTVAVTDARGNAYTVLESGPSSSTSHAAYAGSVLTTGLVAGDLVTATFSNAAQMSSVSAMEFSGASITEDVASTSVAASPIASVGPVTPPSAVTLVIANMMSSGPTGDTFTQDSDTNGGTAWAAFPRPGTTGGTASGNITLNTAWKVTASSAAQTFNPTLGTSRSGAAALMAVRGGAAASVTCAAVQTQAATPSRGASPVRAATQAQAPVRVVAAVAVRPAVQVQVASRVGLVRAVRPAVQTQAGVAVATRVTLLAATAVQTQAPVRVGLALGGRLGVQAQSSARVVGAMGSRSAVQAQSAARGAGLTATRLAVQTQVPVRVVQGGVARACVQASSVDRRMVVGAARTAVAVPVPVRVVSVGVAKSVTQSQGALQVSRVGRVVSAVQASTATRVLLTGVSRAVTQAQAAVRSVLAGTSFVAAQSSVAPRAAVPAASRRALQGQGAVSARAQGATWIAGQSAEALLALVRDGLERVMLAVQTQAAACGVSVLASRVAAQSSVAAAPFSHALDVSATQAGAGSCGRVVSTYPQDDLHSSPMAAFVLGVGAFPVGTSVGVYRGSTLVFDTGPVGALLTAAVTAADGTTTFLALDFATSYVAAAQISGTWRGVAFTTAADVTADDGEVVSAGSTELDLVRDFDADPTGVAVADSAFLAAYATGKQFYVPPGHYKVQDGRIAYGSTPWLMRGAGSGVVFIEYSGTNIVPINLSGTRGAPLALSANAAVGALTITVASVAGLVAGDHIVVSSNLEFYGGGGQGKVGERARILSIAGSVLTLDSRLDEAYLVSDGAKVNKLTDGAVGSHIDGVTFRRVSSNVGAWCMALEYVRQFTIGEDVVFEGWDGPAVSAYTCQTVKCHANFLDLKNNDLDQFGYGLFCSGASRDVTLEGSVMERGRHHFTTGGTVDGVPHHCGANHCQAHGLTQAPYDTHEGGRHIFFNNCEAHGIEQSGFKTRCPDVTITNPLVVGCKFTGIHNVVSSPRLVVNGGRVRQCRGSASTYGINIEGDDAILNGTIVEDVDGPGVVVTANRFFGNAVVVRRPGRDVTAPRYGFLLGGTTEFQGHRLHSPVMEGCEYGVAFATGDPIALITGAPVYRDCDGMSTHIDAARQQFPNGLLIGRYNSVSPPSFGEFRGVLTGTGSPNGVIAGRPGDVYLRQDGTVSGILFVKETGDNTNTGWVAYGAPGAATVEAWTPLTYVNSWADYSPTVYSPGAFFKDPFGMVHLRGLLTGGVTDVIATLPAGYRPEFKAYGMTIGGGAFAAWEVWPDGTLRKDDGAAGGFSIDNVSFRAV